MTGGRGPRVRFISPTKRSASSITSFQRVIGGETVILGLKAGRYYGVDQVGARIWQMVQTPTPVADICNTIVVEYDVDPRRCEADLLRLLDQMVEAHLLEVRTESAS